MEIREQDKVFLSTILTGTDDDAVLECAVEAARFWGLELDVNADEAEFARAEEEVLSILTAIRAGIQDGTISVSSKESPVEENADVDAQAKRVIEALRGE